MSKQICKECEAVLYPCGEVIEWVSVDDELPDADLTVLTCDLDNDVQMGYYDGTDWWHQNASALCGVTHWAEMPVGPS